MSSRILIYHYFLRDIPLSFENMKWAPTFVDSSFSIRIRQNYLFSDPCEPSFQKSSIASIYLKGCFLHFTIYKQMVSFESALVLNYVRLNKLRVKYKKIKHVELIRSLSRSYLHFQKKKLLDQFINIKKSFYFCLFVSCVIEPIAFKANQHFILKKFKLHHDYFWKTCETIQFEFLAADEQQWNYANYNSHII